MSSEQKGGDALFDRTPKANHINKDPSENNEQVDSEQAEKMRVLICGDRHWGDGEQDYPDMESFIKTLSKDSVIIQGAARGADSMAGEIAKKRGLKVDEYPADWKQYGRAAGPIRNKQMLDEGKPNLVVAFHRSLDSSKGTKDMVSRAKKAGIPTKVIG